MGIMLMCCGALSAAASSQVVSYPAPPQRFRSSDYIVRANGVEVPVYRALTQHHDKKYSLAYFDFEGPVTVTIESTMPLDDLQILPFSLGIKPKVKGRTATFTLQKPCDLSFEPCGQNLPLLLFTNPLATDAPDPSDPDVLYFGPGEHNPEGGLI